MTLEALDLDPAKRDFYEHHVFQELNLTNVFLAYDDSNVNLDLAIDLADKVYLEASVDRTLKTKIFFAIYDQMILSQTISDNCDKFRQFYAFANASEVLSRDNIIDQTFDMTAKLIHFSYGDAYDPAILVQDKATWSKIKTKWNNTTTMHDKGSNKAQALHIDIKLAALGLKKVKSSKDKKDLLESNKKIFVNLPNTNGIPDDADVKQWSLELAKCYQGVAFNVHFFPQTFESLFEKIIRCEHNRWNAYHYLLGWQYDPSTRKEIKKHSCLIPFSQFQDSNNKVTVLYDMYSLLYIPNYLADTGFEIVSLWPDVVTIGVTGHREGLSILKLQKALAKEMEFLKSEYGSTTTYKIISPLAEGADRLVAQNAIDILGAQLIVPLPFSKERYKTDFVSDESKIEFDRLLNQAKETINKSGYAEAGRYMVEHSDIIFAVWDGKKAKGQGGTAEIVAYAKTQFKRMIYLSPDGKKVACSR